MEGAGKFHTPPVISVLDDSSFTWEHQRNSIYIMSSLLFSDQNPLKYVCKFLMDNLVDKNPQANNGITPLHEAASYGCLDVCKLIIKNRDVNMGKYFLKYVGNKNPSDNFGQTPLHYAANGGFLEVCKLLIENTAGKNPKDPSGWTPLHLAAQSGHIKVCQLITQHVLDRNPVADDGSTPHSLMIKAANNLFLPLS